jgi:hypothetical protein
MATGTITKRAVDAMKAGRVTPSCGMLTRLWREGHTSRCARLPVPVSHRGRGAPTRRYTIGKRGPLTPDQARTRAKALAHMVEQGTDPRQADDDALAAKAEAKRLAAERARSTTNWCSRR